MGNVVIKGKGTDLKDMCLDGVADPEIMMDIDNCPNGNPNIKQITTINHDKKKYPNGCNFTRGTDSERNKKFFGSCDVSPSYWSIDFDRNKMKYPNSFFSMGAPSSYWTSTAGPAPAAARTAPAAPAADLTAASGTKFKSTSSTTPLADTKPPTTSLKADVDSLMKEVTKNNDRIDRIVADNMGRLSNMDNMNISPEQMKLEQDRQQLIRNKLNELRDRLNSLEKRF